jgi:hypothetical protein
MESSANFRLNQAYHERSKDFSMQIIPSPELMNEVKNPGGAILTWLSSLLKTPLVFLSVSVSWAVAARQATTSLPSELTSPKAESTPEGRRMGWRHK